VPVVSVCLWTVALYTGPEFLVHKQAFIVIVDIVLSLTGCERNIFGKTAICFRWVAGISAFVSLQFCLLQFS